MMTDAQQVALWTAGKLCGENQPIYGVSPLPLAQRHQLTFCTAVPPLSDAVMLCREPSHGQSCIVVDNPRAAFGLVLQKLFPEVHPLGIQPQAFVHPTAQIAEDVHVYPGVWIGAHCTIESKTIIFPNVVIYPFTSIGKRCRIHAGAVLGADGFAYEAISQGLQKIPQVGRLVIEDDVEIGANSCIDRAFLEQTVIGQHSKIDNLVQIAHNTTIGKRVRIASQVGIAGSAAIGDDVMLGGQVGVSDHAIIGAKAQIAAKSGVHGNLSGSRSYWGIPAVEKTLAFRILRRIRRLGRGKEA